jgi:hypothetical protein
VFSASRDQWRKLFSRNRVNKIDKDIAGQLDQLRRYGVYLLGARESYALSPTGPTQQCIKEEMLYGQ